MKPWNRDMHAPLYAFLGVGAGTLIALAGVLWIGAGLAARSGARPGTPGAPYANMPTIAPIGVRVDKYLDIPDHAKGPAVDPAKGYRTEKLGEGLYLLTDGAYQSMFMTYEGGVVVIDAPPSFAAHVLHEQAGRRVRPDLGHVPRVHAHAAQAHRV